MFFVGVDLLCCSMCSAGNVSIEPSFQSTSINNDDVLTPYQLCMASVLYSVCG